MAKKINRISKSQYIKGLQCPKALWYYRHRPDLKPEISESKEHIFSQGHEVGELAQQYFKNGIEITEEYYEIDQAISSTKKAIKNNEKAIYEATACSKDGAYSRIDIFNKVRSSDNWDLVEVKASNEVKEYQISDITFQRYVFSGAGYKIRKSILMHLNREYVRSGDLDLKKLFKLEDFTKITKEQINDIKPNVENLIKILKKRKEPEVEIGGHCGSPFECDYMYHCWKHIPDYSVYNVFRGKKLEELLDSGILKVSDVPDNFDTTSRQAIDVNAYKKNRVYKDKIKIKSFLSSLVYPLYFLDYETIMPAIPLFDKSSPYQQIPFQFSLHVQKKKGGSLKHIEFLHTESGDPRTGFIKTLVENCGSKGSVVVYNQGFESARNNELGKFMPKYKTALNKINKRMVDLMVPFRSRFLYHPKMEGSASLKSVLPIFTRDSSYENMEISDGGMASTQYLDCIKNKVAQKEKEKIYENLRIYCEQDTLAEVKLLEVLYDI